MADKKGIAILLGAPSKDAGAEESEYAGPPDEELQAASDDVFDALKADDRPAFASALHSYVKLCGMAEK